MNSSKTQVMTCGACAVSMDENGQMTTSIDMLVDGVKRFASKFNRRSSSRNATVSAHI